MFIKKSIYINYHVQSFICQSSRPQSVAVTRSWKVILGSPNIIDQLVLCLFILTIVSHDLGMVRVSRKASPHQGIRRGMDLKVRSPARSNCSN